MDTFNVSQPIQPRIALALSHYDNLRGQCLIEKNTLPNPNRVFLLPNPAQTLSGGFKEKKKTAPLLQLLNTRL